MALAAKCSRSISCSLTALFNFSLETGQVASEWKLARVTPVPKHGSFEKVEDFCPMPVLPVVAKLLEQVVRRQLYAYLHKHSILNMAQSEFGLGHTTQDVLVATVDNWRQALDEGKVVGSVMLDRSKAFDMICHPIMGCKLACYEVLAEELEWFDQYLAGRKQMVCMGEAQSICSDILRGVP